MVSEEFVLNCVEIVLNCVDVVLMCGLDGVIVLICEGGDLL